MSANKQKAKAKSKTRVTRKAKGQRRPWSSALAKAATKADESQVIAHLSLMELEGKWEKIQDKFAKQVDLLRNLEKSAHTASDEVKVQAHLASAGIKDAINHFADSLAQVGRQLASRPTKRA